MNELPKTFELDEQIFKEAVFESIRLWCTSEYFYSENLKNALNQFKDNNYNNKDFSKRIKIYEDFLSDYSIARTRKSDDDIKPSFFEFIFVKLLKKELPEKEIVTIVDDIAVGLSEKHTPNGLTPTSLVSKTLFLLYPEQIIMFDSRGLKSLKEIFKKPNSNINHEMKEKIKNLKSNIKEKRYQNYYNAFEAFYEIVYNKAKNITRGLLNETNCSIIKKYYIEIFYKYSKWKTNKFIGIEPEC